MEIIMITIIMYITQAIEMYKNEEVEYGLSAKAEFFV